MLHFRANFYQRMGETGHGPPLKSLKTRILLCAVLHSQESAALLDGLMNTQSRDAVGSAGKSLEQIMGDVAEDILERLPQVSGGQWDKLHGERGRMGDNTVPSLDCTTELLHFVDSWQLTYFQLPGGNFFDKSLKYEEVYQ